MLAKFFAVDSRGPVALEVNQVRYVLLVCGWCWLTRGTSALFACPRDSDDKVGGGIPWCLAVEAPVEEKDFASGPARTSDGLANPTEDEGRDERSVERSDAVDDGLGRLDCLQDFGVDYRVHLLAVRVDVPDSRDPGG